MFLLFEPDISYIRRFLSDREQDTLSYNDPGATQGNIPAGFNTDHNRIKIGDGPECFILAKAAMRRWEMFAIPWVRLCFPDTPIEVGRDVAILVRHFGFYSLNAARIVYTIDEAGDGARFGFAYGTLSEHAESGEERFSVEFHEATGEVWYDLYAFSRPASWLAKAGYSVSRSLQKSFARESKLAMQRAVLAGPSDPAKLADSC